MKTTLKASNNVYYFTTLFSNILPSKTKFYIICKTFPNMLTHREKNITSVEISLLRHMSHQHLLQSPLNEGSSKWKNINPYQPSVHYDTSNSGFPLFRLRALLRKFSITDVRASVASTASPGVRVCDQHTRRPQGTVYSRQTLKYRIFEASRRVPSF